MAISETYLRIYRTIQQVPPGKVATYGQIAARAGMPGQARLVGYALHKLPESMDVPWHRVLNARGKISRLPDPDGTAVQRQLLESEGIRFDASDCVDLRNYCL